MLDDVLAAVDANVGQRICQDLILGALHVGVKCKNRMIRMMKRMPGTHNVAEAAVWSTLWRQPLIFPRKNTHPGSFWRAYQISLRSKRGALPGVKQ